MFSPRFTISAAMTRALMAIESDRQAVLGLPIDVRMLATLRATAKLVSTHYSTQIEGNRLTQKQVADTIRGSRFPGRERDEREVRNYYAAIEWVEKRAALKPPLVEQDARILHRLVMDGKTKPSGYRDGQNVIRDSRSSQIVYLPPEAKEVPRLMADLFAWITAQSASSEWPTPIVAAVAHYQFATIHPYYDGNGRTARLLTTLILHRHGYGLNGIYALEEYYARNLKAYYKALAIGNSYNYYAGRAAADISPFVGYFLDGMSDAFAHVRQRATEAAERAGPDSTALIRSLNPRQREVLRYFRTRATATIADLAAHLGLSARTVRPLAQEWVRSGFLIVADPSRKARSYRLTPEWEAIAAR